MLLVLVEGQCFVYHLMFLTNISTALLVSQLVQTSAPPEKVLLQKLLRASELFYTVDMSLIVSQRGASQAR